jgi:hypothetical protein
MLQSERERGKKDADNVRQNGYNVVVFKPLDHLSATCRQSM